MRMHVEFVVTRDVKVKACLHKDGRIFRKKRRYKAGEVVYFVEDDGGGCLMDADGWWVEFPEGALQEARRPEAGGSAHVRSAGKRCPWWASSDTARPRPGVLDMLAPSSN